MNKTQYMKKEWQYIEETNQYTTQSFSNSRRTFPKDRFICIPNAVWLFI